MSTAIFLGLDFGTEAVRAVLVDPFGRTAASASAPFAHGQIVRSSGAADRLFPTPLPPAYALQHPADWINSTAQAIRSALQSASISPRAITGIGVDFTSCTMLPCTRDGVPLCLADNPLAPTTRLSQLATEPHAWPKLWKHHGAFAQTERINAIARERNERWLARYGGVVGIEWLLPKTLEVIDDAPHVADAAQLWIEAGDWFVWQLVGGDTPPRSTCQAGYKACWSAAEGFPSREYLAQVNPALADAVEHKYVGRFTPPGVAVGELAEPAARRLGLEPGPAVSAAIIDAHAGVPGAGVGAPDNLVMVLGTSGCHMLLSQVERHIPGVAGIVRDGILPGYVGYETGQAAMGDAFDLVRRLTRHEDFQHLDRAAATLTPGADGVLCLDWFNGCRTPLMDASLAGAFLGLSLSHGPEHLYRAALEASAFGLRWIVDTLRDGGVPVTRFTATGGLPTHNPAFIHIVASVLNAELAIHPAPHGPALGAAIIAALAAGSTRGGYDDVHQAVACMAGNKSAWPPPRIVKPRTDHARQYDRLYRRYRDLAQTLSAPASPIRH